VRQLITRVDDQLLDDVKARARAEGVSVNTFVNRLLARAVETMDRRRDLDRRIAEAGLAVAVTPSQAPLPLDEAIALTRGLGPQAGRALDWTRGPR
jgi:hypothetical protein